MSQIPSPAGEERMLAIYWESKITYHVLKIILTLTADPQLLTGKENRALVASEPVGPQSLFTRLALAGDRPLRTAADRSATTVIFPSVEHTAEACILVLCVLKGDLRVLQERQEVLTNEFWSSEGTLLDSGALDL